MKSDIFWTPAPTPGRLAIVPRPRGGDWLSDEVQSWRSEGVDIVVSLLTSEENDDLDISNEQAACEAHGIEFRTFPIVDRGIPTSKRAFLELVTALANDLAIGKNIAIHCRQGIGRAPLVAIAVLMLAGIDLEIATKNVRQTRGCPVPETVEQQRWLADFAKGLPVVAGK